MGATTDRLFLVRADGNPTLLLGCALRRAAPPRASGGCSPRSATHRREQQKENLREWIAANRGVFEESLQQLLLSRPEDPRAYLAQALEGKAAPAKLGDVTSPEEQRNAMNEYVAKHKAYLQVLWALRCATAAAVTLLMPQSLFVELLRSTPGDPRGFALQFLQSGKTPVLAARARAPQALTRAGRRCPA